VYAVATGELGGRPIAISASDDTTLRSWELTSAQSPLGRMRRLLRLRDSPSLMHAGHAGRVTSVALGEIAATQIVVSGGEDQTIQLRRMSDAALLCNMTLDSTVTDLALVSTSVLIAGTTQGLAAIGQQTGSNQRL
jgi:WD40 repeat protein